MKLHVVPHHLDLDFQLLIADGKMWTKTVSLKLYSGPKSNQVWYSCFFHHLTYPDMFSSYEGTCTCNMIFDDQVNLKVWLIAADQHGYPLLVGVSEY